MSMAVAAFFGFFGGVGVTLFALFVIGELNEDFD